MSSQRGESTDQTRFSLEEPLLRSVDEGDEVADAALIKSTSKKRRLLVGGAVVLLLVILVLAIIASQGRKQVAPDIKDVAEENDPHLGPLEERIVKLKNDLGNADPTKQELPFPLLDMDLRLDKK